MINVVQSYRQYITKTPVVGVAFFIIGIWMLVAIFAPLFESLLGVGFGDIEPAESLLPPFSHGANAYHYLGTDYLGRDLLAGLIHGSRVAFIISFLSISFSLVIGLSVGLVIGYYGDHKIRRNLIQQALLFLGLIYIGYYLIAIFDSGITIYNVLPMLIVIIIVYVLDRLASRLPIKKYGVPLDIIMQRVFELRESIPSLFIILSVAALFTTSSIYSVAFIISILFWITFARHMRAETWRVKEEAYITNAISSGMNDVQLLWKHILPNALPSIYVIIAFAFSSVILLESSLSFLGIGIPVEEISWGKILAGARKSNKAWWLAVFPGLAIFLVLFSFNVLGDYLAQYQKRNDV